MPCTKPLEFCNSEQKSMNLTIGLKASSIQECFQHFYGIYGLGGVERN